MMVHRDKILCFLVLFCCFFAHTPLQAQQPRKKVGLVLGGGGAKGAAEVGVLKVLEEADIPCKISTILFSKEFPYCTYCK